MVPQLSPHPPPVVGDILATLAQRRNLHREVADPIVEVRVEALPKTGGVEVRCTHELHVDGQLFVAAERPEAALAVLEHPDELALRGLRQVLNLVEEQDPAVRLRQQSRPIARGAGEGALSVSEEQALGKRGVETAAGNGDDLPASLQGRDECLDDPGLAGSALAENQKRGSCHSGVAGQPLERRAAGRRSCLGLVHGDGGLDVSDLVHLGQPSRDRELDRVDPRAPRCRVVLR